MNKVIHTNWKVFAIQIIVMLLCLPMFFLLYHINRTLKDNIVTITCTVTNTAYVEEWPGQCRVEPMVTGTVELITDHAPSGSWGGYKSSFIVRYERPAGSMDYRIMGWQDNDGLVSIHIVYDRDGCITSIRKFYPGVRDGGDWVHPGMKANGLEEDWERCRGLMERSIREQKSVFKRHVP